MKKIIFFIFNLSLGSVWAHPTERPLPKGMVDESPLALVLRDHAEKDRFYVLPKSMNVKQTPYFWGEEKLNCQIIEDFQASEAMITKTRRDLVEVQNSRVLLLKQIFENMQKFESQRTALVLRKYELEDAIEEMKKDESANSQGLEEIQKRLNRVEDQLKGITTEIDRYERLDKAANEQVTQVAKHLKDLEDNDQKYLEKVSRPVATINAEITLDPIFSKEKELEAKLGLMSQSFQIPSIISLELSPSERRGENGGIDERDRIREAMGAYTPTWSEPSFSFSETDLENTNTLDQRPIPQKIAFEQILSLFSYCLYKSPTGRKQDIRVPLQVKYSTLLHVDQEAAPYLRSEILSYRTILGKKSWDLISGLELFPVEPLIYQIDDRGDPSLYAQNGKLRSKTVSLNLIPIVPTTNDENKGELK